jgi:single-strand DNA-binding protein
MANMNNQVTLIGNLAGDLERRELNGGHVVARVLLAVDRGWGRESKTDWVRVVFWNKQAESAMKYLGKGSKVAISGRLRSEFYEVKGSDGKARLDTEVVVDQVQYLSRPREAAAAPARAAAGGKA